MQVVDRQLAGSPQGSQPDSPFADSQAHSIADTVELAVPAPVRSDKLAVPVVELASQEQNSIVADTVVAQPVAVVKLWRKFVVKKIAEHFALIAGLRMKIRSNEVAPHPKYQ